VFKYILLTTCINLSFVISKSNSFIDTILYYSDLETIRINSSTEEVSLLLLYHNIFGGNINSSVAKNHRCTFLRSCVPNLNYYQ